MTDASHLIALQTRLANETERHGDNPRMAGYLESIRREIRGEYVFLGMEPEIADMSDDDLLDALAN